MKTDVTLDAIGLRCPLPAVKTAMRLETMDTDQILEVLTTDSISKVDLPAWCKETGNELVTVKDEGEVFKIYIRKR
ncbi:MAG TPA: sulfurtransferase TusA family protein [Actinobacteria bacterium]|nr:sulfurtransferase TusA family protein [Actinomycetes bacterium]HEX21745.1 sulfurtransferase TusA family protein [Actinomycetota bacterium]